MIWEREVISYLTMAFRRNPLYTWPSAFVVVCESSSCSRLSHLRSSTIDNGKSKIRTRHSSRPTATHLCGKQLECKFFVMFALSPALTFHSCRWVSLFGLVAMVVSPLFPHVNVEWMLVVCAPRHIDSVCFDMEEVFDTVLFFLLIINTINNDQT
jgi:hypothetical protein